MKETITEVETEYMPFSFNGNDDEFFRIWIVNIALTILTLGVYSAWAKVRTNRYFYANTYLNGSNFEYNAEPKRILIGRLIVVGVYALFLLFYQYLAMFEVAEAIAIIALLAMPWLIHQAVSFRLRNISYRNIPFRYEGKISSFYYLFIVNALLPLTVILIAFKITPAWDIFLPILYIIVFFLFSAYIYVQFKKLIINNSYYGNGKFEFVGKDEDVFGIYLKITGWMLIIGTFMIILLFVTEIYISIQFSSISDSILELITYVYILPIVFFQKGISDGYHSNFISNNTLLNNAPLKSDINSLKLGWINGTNILVIIFSLGLFYPWAKIRYTKYKLEHTYLKCSDYEQFKSQGYIKNSTIGEETVDFFDINIGL